ncbi:uncharacterized protein EAF02_011889 [Botrytis sinoallii]|uniref:uncharacterized protein n=1 Tax=Botrytis sinoallii TaxID=1463999 RepID=UPI0019029D6B|nr:uncharacterized protein EAF02_011889 [Botrytis sinoallii]KAF7853584.1 hypothetical protein EAF02_011889 [Botrytis sinoallii]
MAAKKKKATAASTSRLPAGTVSLPASKAEDRAPSAENEDLSLNPQQVKEKQESWPLHAPMIEYESCDEKCAGWGSDADSGSEGSLDDDMDFLPTGWGKNKKQSSEDKERAEIARKAKMKKEKSQASSAVVVAACREETPTASDGKVEVSRTLVKLAKSCTNTESTETALELSGDIAEQVTRGSVIEDIKVIKSTTSLENSCLVCASQSSETVTSNTTIQKSKVPDPKPSIKLMEKMARQERDLKSAKTQAGSLRAEIEVLNQKHRLEMQKQLDQLNESHLNEMEAMKLDLEEAQAARQKASTDLRKVREKNPAVRTERRELDLKLGAMNEEVVRLGEKISTLETQKNDAQISAESLFRALRLTAQDVTDGRLKLDVVQEHSATFQQQVRSLRVENHRIRQEQSRTASTSNRLQQLETRYENLKTDHYTLEDEHNELQEDAARYRREREEYKGEAEYYKKKRNALRDELESVEASLEKMTAKYASILSSRDAVRQSYQELKKAHDIREPLAKIGADIRLRFLDQARETALNISRCEADMALRTNGNVAAHRGNAATDAALFKGKLIPEEYEEEAEEIFQKLYSHESSDYPFYDRISERQIDCEATLSTIKESSVSAPLREEWRVVWNRILHGPANKKMVLIEELESLTDEIVDLERSSRRRR